MYMSIENKEAKIEVSRYNKSVRIIMDEVHGFEGVGMSLSVDDARNIANFMLSATKDIEDKPDVEPDVVFVDLETGGLTSDTDNVIDL